MKIYLLQKAGFGNIFSSQGKGIGTDWFLTALKLRLKDMSEQDWHAATRSNHICSNYKMMKKELAFEKYFLILSVTDATTLCKFRCRSHRLPINNNRFSRDSVNDDLCTLCSLKEVGDEFHYLFVCPFFSKERRMYIPTEYFIRPCVYQMGRLFSLDKRCH